LKVVIFARVSSDDQKTDRQLSDLQEVAAKQKYEVVKTITAKISGNKTKRQDRKDLDELLTLAREGRYKKVLITEVSRLGRRPQETYQLMEALTELGVSVYAHNLGLETLLPTGKRNPAAAMIFSLFNEISRTETDMLSDRIRSGQAEAKRQGKHIGRPSGTVANKVAVIAKYPKVVKHLKEENLSLREIAKRCGVALNTVVKVKALLKNER
jgi:DNA invertase Pin-like site-specific DNA recombinase